jgi:sec-independent protein translocase protein TatB
MFGLSFGELAIIAILALLLLGPDRLPDAARTLAKGLRDLRRASEDLKDKLGSEKKVVEEAKRTVTGALTGALADGALEGRPAPLPPRGPPPSASPQNVPGLEAALVEPGPSSPAPGSGGPKP